MPGAGEAPRPFAVPTAGANGGPSLASTFKGVIGAPSWPHNVRAE